MKVTVKYFGSLAEKTGIKEEIVDLDQTGTRLDQLKAHCVNKYGLDEDSSIQLAVNQELNSQKQLQNGDEIAFLPPFAGG